MFIVQAIGGNVENSSLVMVKKMKFSIFAKCCGINFHLLRTADLFLEMANYVTFLITFRCSSLSFHLAPISQIVIISQIITQ